MTLNLGKIFQAVLLGLLMMSAGAETVSAKSNTLSKKQLQKYKPLKKNEGRRLASLYRAKLSDVNLAKRVKYFDIKEYETGYDLKYLGGWSFDMVAYKKLTVQEKRKIHSVQPTMAKGQPFGATYFVDSPMKSIYNLHYIDMHSKVHTFASRKELLAFIGVIDTPAEVHMVLLNAYGNIRYKKMGHLYIIRSECVMHEDYDGGKYDCYLSVYHQIMDNRGNILLNKEIMSQGYSGKKCDKL